MPSSRKMMSSRNQQRCTNILGLSLGIFFGFFVTAGFRYSILRGGLIFNCERETESIYSSENDNFHIVEEKQEVEMDNNKRKDLVFVGVMTASKYIETRAIAVYETWGKTLPGKVAFFSSADSTTNFDIPLIPLPGVDDSYPPQKKSFLMLKYIHDNYLEKYEWFMRADDDVYVRSDQLELFLRSVNSSKVQFIGQAGMGKKEEQGELSLEENENFCMGGPGMVMSRETLRRVVPHVKECLKNLYSTHEDVEVGRCIRKYAKISCTWSYEMQTIFYHNFSGNDAFTGNLKQKEVHRAITLHPIKQHQYQYRLHNYMQSLKIQELRQTILVLLRDINQANIALNQSSAISVDDDQIDIEHLGKKPSLHKFQPATDGHVIPWDFFMRVVFSHTNTNPKRRMEDSTKEALEDVVNHVMELINKYSLQRGRVIDFKEILYGYRRVVPTYGVDYILDLLLMYKRYRGRKMTTPVRRHAYFQQTFTQMQMREVKMESLNKLICFILPLSGRSATFSRFLINYEKVCVNENVKLVVVLYESEDVDKNKEIFNNFHRKSPNSQLIWGGKTFSRGKAIQLGAEQLKDDNLLFFIDVDMIFTKDTLLRIRTHTIRHQQVYFPIIFSQYNPTMNFINKSVSDPFEISEESGYWRMFGFGIGSMYKSDLLAIGGFDVKIEGWGREDVDLYDKCVRSNLTIFRAPDPGLVHVYHVIECDHNLTAPQFAMCIGSLANSFGSVYKLGDFVYKNVLNDDGSISL